MSYDIQNTDGSLNYSVADNQVNTSQFSLALIGRNTANYGQYFAQNAIRHLENFASSVPPTPGTKLIGQLWFDKNSNENLIRVWDGTNWKRMGVSVGTSAPTEGEGAGTQFFNLNTNKLEVHNGTAFVDANYPGEVTTAYSSDATNGSPAHYGARLRTLFLKTDAGTTLPVLALVYTKSGSTGNVGTTTVGGQKETIMTLYSDHPSFTIANPTATAVGSETIDYYPELTGTGGIASARTGRAAGIILPGANQRAEYEASQTSNFSTLYATSIGDASNPVSTQHVDTLTVNTQLNIPGAASVTGDLSVGGSIGLTGDITGATSIATFANLVVSANTTLSGDTTINGNLTLNGVNTQSLGTDSEKVETIFGNSIDTQSLTVDGTATIATLNSTNMTVQSLATLTSATISGVTTMNGAVNLGDASADTITVNGTTTFVGGTTFNSDIVLGSGTDLTISNGTLVLAGSSSISGAASKVLIDNQGSLSNQRFLTFVNGSTDDTQYSLENDAGLTFVPQTNLLSTTDISATGTLSFGSLSDGTITITQIVDEDNMASNSPTMLPTQQSVKAYVDSQVTASDDDLNVTGDSGSITIDLDTETLGIKTGAGLTSAASGNDVTVSLDTTITGLTSVTSSAFVGDITGDVTSSGTSNFNNVTLTGLLTGTSTKANTVNLADEPSSASAHHITFSAGATGYEALKTESGLQYFPSTNTIVASRFQGRADIGTKVTLTATNSANASHFPLFADSATGDEDVRTDSGYTYNPSSGTLTATIFSGTATQAQYADLAEIYSTDADYEPGTVVKLGGSAEITQTVSHADQDVFGVISTDPAFLMNKDAEGLPVALTGRVPVKVIGKIKKGERLVSSDVPGVAWALGEDEYDARAVIGRALQDKDNGDEGLIEAVIGVK